MRGIVSGNAAEYFVDRHLAEGRSEKIAFREASGAKRHLSYGALADQSNQLHRKRSCGAGHCARGAGGLHFG